MPLPTFILYLSPPLSCINIGSYLFKSHQPVYSSISHCHLIKTKPFPFRPPYPKHAHWLVITGITVTAWDLNPFSQSQILTSNKYPLTLLKYSLIYNLCHTAPTFTQIISQVHPISSPFTQPNNLKSLQAISTLWHFASLTQWRIHIFTVSSLYKQIFF
jgi:hypothetical protein